MVYRIHADEVTYVDAS